MNKRKKESNKQNKFTYKIYLVCAVVICFLFLLSICPILNGVNNLRESGKFMKWLADCETINEGVKDWLGFWASFSGTLATVLVGAVTLRLTEKIQKQNEAEEKLKKQLSIITKMPYMTCTESCICSLKHGDFLYEHLTMEGIKNNYCLMLQLDKSFPPYFDIELQSISIYLPKQEDIKKFDLTSNDYKFVNHDGVKIVINLPEELEDIMYHVYVLDLEMTNVTPREKRNVYIGIGFSCKNVLFDNENTDDSKVDFNLKITVENVGRNEKLKGKRLRVNNLQFERVN